MEFCYAPVEGEALALVYRLESCRIFVMGSPDLLVSVDHKPLVKIFPDKALEDTKKPQKTEIVQFERVYTHDRFQIRHLPRRLNVAPDCALWYPASERHIYLANVLDHCS